MVSKAESSGDFDEGRVESKECSETNMLMHIRKVVSFLQLCKTGEVVVGIMFYLLSPKINQTVLSCAERGMDKSCSLWPPADLALDTTTGCGCDATAFQTKKKPTHLLFKIVMERH